MWGGGRGFGINPSVRRSPVIFKMEQVFNILVSWVFCPNLPLGGTKICFCKCWKKKNLFFYQWEYIFFLIKSNILLQFWKTIALNFLLRWNISVAQKLQILEFLKELFFAWTLANSETSWGRNFNLIDLNRVFNWTNNPGSLELSNLQCLV